MVALGTVNTKALKLAVGIDEAQTVAIGKRRHSAYGETLALHFLHLSHILAESLRCVGREDVGLATVGKICSIATIESLPQVGIKAIIDPAEGCTPVFVGMGSHNLV